MCTVVVEVPATPEGYVRLLAVRDEEPTRPWDPPGAWWPELPDTIGVRDRRAGGAWLAERGGRLAVLLNRAEIGTPGLPAPSGLRSRGTLVLDDVRGEEVPDPPQTAGFNLVSVRPGAVTITSWDGERLTRERLAPGVHMVAHHGVDDPRSARIETWLPEFRRLAGLGEDWREAWVELLTRTARLPIDDDRAIIRDNHAHGYPTASLLVCTAEVRGERANTSSSSMAASAPSVSLESATLGRPAIWDSPAFRPAPLPSSEA